MKNLDLSRDSIYVTNASGRSLGLQLLNDTQPPPLAHADLTPPSTRATPDTPPPLTNAKRSG